MLWLASITSTTPNALSAGLVAGTTLDVRDRLPVLAHLDGSAGETSRREREDVGAVREARAARRASSSPRPRPRRRRRQSASAGRCERGPPDHRSAFIGWPCAPRRVAVGAGPCANRPTERDAVLLELVQERRPQAGGLQAADDDAVAGDLLDLELEESCSVITSDSIRCTSVIAVTPARAVVEALEVDDQVERRGDLLADRAHGQVVAGHQHHRLDARERVARRVGVHRGERAVVARVHRLEHVQRLGAADLADDDPVGAHAQRVADELADRDLALALDVLRPRLEAGARAAGSAGARRRPRS